MRGTRFSVGSKESQIMLYRMRLLRAQRHKQCGRGETLRRHSEGPGLDLIIQNSMDNTMPCAMWPLKTVSVGAEAIERDLLSLIARLNLK